MGVFVIATMVSERSYNITFWLVSVVLLEECWFFGDFYCCFSFGDCWILVLGVVASADPIVVWCYLGVLGVGLSDASLQV